MGQKVHPIGFRVGITKRHQSQWFARFTKNAYAQSILEDRLLRNTLISFANEALNPTNSGVKNQTGSPSIGGDKGKGSAASQQSPSTPKVTHIKIERGLIPYEIAIAIYAENCKRFKSSLTNLKINRELLGKLQKTRRFLISLAASQEPQQNKHDSVSTLSLAPSLNQAVKSEKETKQGVTSRKDGPMSESLLSNINSTANNLLLTPKKIFFFRNHATLTKKNKKSLIEIPKGLKKPFQTNSSFSKMDGFKKGKLRSGVAKKFSSQFVRQVYKTKGIIIQRLKKRQEIRRRYRKLMLKGLFLQKKGKVILSKPSCFLPNQKKIKRKKFISSSYPLRRVASSSAEGPQRDKVKNKLLTTQKNQSGRGKSGASLSLFMSGKKKTSLNLGKNSKGRISRFASKNPEGKSSPKGNGRGAKKSQSSASGIFSSVFFQNQERKNDQSLIGYRLKKKFLSLFIEKSNKRFLKHLKKQITIWHKKLQLHRQEQIKVHGSLRFAPLGYNQKWNLKRLNFLKTKPLVKMGKLVSLIEEKAFIKLQSLRDDFIAFGTISKGEALNFYQIVNFLKNLRVGSKTLRRQRLRQNQKALLLSSLSELGPKRQSLSPSSKNPKALLNVAGAENTNLLKTVISQSYDGREDSALKRVNSSKTINNECRKIYFIEYLKEIVKKHRTQYLYYYLSTISDARKNLKKITQFTKLNSNFLFGFDFNTIQTQPLTFPSKNQGIASSPAEGPQEGMVTSGNLPMAKVSSQMTSKEKLPYTKAIKETITKRYSQTSDLEKGLSPAIFLEEIEKQRVMYRQIAELNPKITIKFYSVKSKIVKAKASTITDSVIDALEKRKAFKKVIRDAKESLMKNPNVKGVKIQVSGRLNGAEIARTEWVRAGRVPLQTLRSNLDYSNKTAKTIYGIIGVKVWIFKGYTKLV